MKMEHLGAISKAENFCFIFKANCPTSQCVSFAQWCPNIWDSMDCNTPGFSVKHQLLETAQTHDYWVGDAIQLSHSLLSPSPSAFHLSSIRVFSNESVLLMRWPKYGSFSFSISLSNEYSGLIFFFFWMDLLDLLAVNGTLKIHHQYHSSKVSILWYSAFFIVQPSHPYMTSGKTIALTRQTFVGKVMSLVFHAFYTSHSFSSKEQVSFNSMAAITTCSDFGAQENKLSHCFHCFPIYLPWTDQTGCHDLCFLNV